MYFKCLSVECESSRPTNRDTEKPGWQQSGFFVSEINARSQCRSVACGAI